LRRGFPATLIGVIDMKTLNVILGVLVLAAATLAAPAMLASIVAGSAGLLMLAPAPVVQTVQMVRQIEAPTVNVFELEGGTGVVVFRQVNGKLVSRMYRAQA
jgi:predicted phage tail protein